MSSPQVLAQAPVGVQSRLRFVMLAIALSAAFILVLAIPTAIIDNPFFTRMTPVEPEQYVFWIATGILTGTLLATYIEPSMRRGLAGQGMGAGLLGAFAIGCPICNKLVVGILGVSGALTYFAPVQPILGVAAVGLAGYALWTRLRPARNGACALDTAKSL